MLLFEVTLLLLLGGLALVLAAPALGLPWPALLAVGGTVLALIPGVPTIRLDPELALALFFAPVLLDAAFDTNPRALLANWRPVVALVIVAVLLTTLSVAVVARLIVPEMPWGAAIALGAIVAPPDAAAATAVLQHVRLPQRVVLILAGESLLNDASALLLYEAALQATAGAAGPWTMPVLALGAVGGLALGPALAFAYLSTISRYVRERHRAAYVLLQFLSTFGVWILAGALHFSAVLTVVSYGMTLAWQVRGSFRPRERRMSYAVWEVVVFGLNVMAFLLTGLQIRAILLDMTGLGRAIGLAVAVLVVCIVVRMVWAIVYRDGARRRARRNDHEGVPPRGAVLVIGWAGMRGLVTLAAALSLPAAFPQRELIQFVAFAVVLGTLGLQGMTLGPAIKRLRLPGDGRETEENAAREAAARAALEALAADRDTAAGKALAAAYERRLTERADGAGEDGLVTLRQRTLEAERRELARMHQDGQIGDSLWEELEEELDWAAASLDRPTRHGG